MGLWKRVWALTILVGFLAMMGSCRCRSSDRPLQGFFLDRAQLKLDPNTGPTKPETGNHWVVWFDEFRSGATWISETARQTLVLIEFEAQPAFNQTIDLATQPLNASYEYGGQMLLYISHKVSGTLTLRKGEQNTIVAQLNASFGEPVLGSGTKVIQGKFVLNKFPHPDFTTP